MRYPPPRAGEPLSIVSSDFEFSFFPMRRGSHRWGLSSMVYAADPWAIILGAVDNVSPAERTDAESFVRQAKEYFVAADGAAAIETKPLLYYYSFLNLAKTLAMTRGRSGLVGRVHHGITVVGGGQHTVPSASVEVRQTNGAGVSAIDELCRSLTGTPIVAGHVPVADLVMQSVVGHRLWADALGRKERFLSVDHIAVLHDADAKTLWSTVRLRSDLLKRRDWGVDATRQMSGLGTDFRIVTGEPGYRTFEMVSPVNYTGRAADKAMEIVASVRPHLWQTVTAVAPFRRYYLFLNSAGERRLHQVVSAYALLFWLGSLTRYQPADLLALLTGTYGGFIREFLATQPAQLLYVLASEFRQQDVARAAIV